MIESTDNPESTNYTHQCSDIFKIKLSNSKEKKNFTEKSKSNLNDNLISTTNLKSTDKKSPANEKFENKINNRKLNDKLNYNSNDKFNDSLNYRSNDKSNDKSTSKFNQKLNDNLSNKSTSNKLNRGKIKEENPVDKSTDKPIDKSTNLKKKIDKKANSKKSNSTKLHPSKLNSNIPINRKRSDIENIFNFNSIKRVKSEMSKRPLVFCGPSGSGKSSLLKKLIGDFPEHFGFSVSHTTRKPREGEVDGKDYYYVTREEMLKAIENDEFIEYAEFSSNIYGTSKKAVEDIRNKGKICILDIEVEGVKNVKKSHLDPLYIFLKPPTLEVLENRLRKRGSETEESIQKRLKRAKDEIAFGEVKDNFDLLLVNDDLKSAYKELKSFVLENYGLADTAEQGCETEKPETDTS